MAAAGIALIGRQYAGVRAGLGTGLVFALLPLVQTYAQEGRSYATVCALVVWATYLLPRAGAGYAALLLLAVWTHQFALLALLAHGVTVRLTDGLPTRAWLRSAAVVAAGSVPLAVVAARQSAQVSWLGGPGLTDWLLLLALALVGLLCAHAVGGPRTPLAALVLPLLVVPPLVLMTVSLLRPLYVDRYVLYSAAGLALLAGAALARLSRDRRRTPAAALVLAEAAAVAGALLSGAQLRTPQSRKDDVVAIAREVERTARPGDGVLFMPARRREWSMTDPEAFRAVRDLALDRTPLASGTLWGTELGPAEIRRRMLRTPRIVVLRDPVGQPSTHTRARWRSGGCCVRTSRRARRGRYTAHGSRCTPEAGDAAR